MVRVREIAIAACLLGILSSGSALAQTTTNCRVGISGRSINCNTYTPQQPSAADAIIQGYGAGLLLRDLFGSRREEEERAAAIAAERQRQAAEAAYMAQARAEAQKNEALFAMVSQAIQNGQCEDAKAIALADGRLDVAEKAMRLCTPKANRK